MRAVERLHEELTLGEEAALLVDSLSEPETRRLVDVLDAAREAETHDLDAALDDVVASVPSVARGRVRRTLRGESR